MKTQLSRHITMLLTSLILSLTACSKETATPASQTTSPTHDMSTMNHMEVKTDEEFIKGMIPHHQEAVDTSLLITQNTRNAELKKFTQAVIDGQSAEITQMKAWHQSWFNKPYVADNSYMAMMGDVSQYKSGTDEADTLYIKGMIAHHEGAVQMAKQALGFTQRAEIKAMADAIIKTQTEEIALLKSWLK